MDAARDAGTAYGYPMWFTAAQQTSAHGRRGRPWVAPEGNFYGTLSLPVADVTTAALRSFVASLALYDALRAVMGDAVSLGLKWPNDVLLNGGKVAGILLETLRAPQMIWGVSIGIGVNLIVAPRMDQVEVGASYPVSIKGESGVDVTPDVFLSHLAPAFARWDAQLVTYGFAPIRTAWLARAARLGETLTARLVHETITGRFDTVDENGYLILSTANGPRTIAAADVFFES